MGGSGWHLFRISPLRVRVRVRGTPIIGIAATQRHPWELLRPAGAGAAPPGREGREGRDRPSLSSSTTSTTTTIIINTISARMRDREERDRKSRPSRPSRPRRWRRGRGQGATTGGKDANSSGRERLAMLALLPKRETRTLLGPVSLPPVPRMPTCTWHPCLVASLPRTTAFTARRFIHLFCRVVARLIGSCAHLADGSFNLPNLQRRHRVAQRTTPRKHLCLHHVGGQGSQATLPEGSPARVTG
jgi:hypothetical protein